MKKNLLLIIPCLLFVFSAYSFTQNVKVENHVFDPASFNINLGDTIVWTWVSGTHTTTSLTIPSGAVSWDKSITTSNKTFTYIPSKTGTYNYQCTFHFTMGMVGNFTVVCPNANIQISAAGSTTFCSKGSVLLNSNTTSTVASYKWQKDGADIANATGASYIAKTKGSYTLVVTNNCGKTATSNAIVVTINTLPVATITPSDTVFICSGDTATLRANAGQGLSYQWQRNGSNIASATSRIYKTTKFGGYKVIVTKTATGCVKTSPVTRVVIKCEPGISEVHHDGIKIYPNPSSSGFNISMSSFGRDDEYIVTVFDVNGRTFGNKKITSKDFSFGNNLAPGVYFVEIRNSKALVAREKILKMK